MRALHLPAFEYRRMRWKNQLGWTREILRAPDLEDFDWRASIAEIDHDCGFSAFPGHDRILVLLSGNGLQLRFQAERVVVLEPPHQRVAFNGEDVPDCRLIDGPTRDFNLIWKRDRVRAELIHRPLVGPMLFFPEPGVSWLIHLIAGNAQIRDRPGCAPIESGDSVLLSADAHAGRCVLDGAGEVLLARVEQLRR